MNWMKEKSIKTQLRRRQLRIQGGRTTMSSTTSVDGGESKAPAVEKPSDGVMVTCTAPVNIAVIKYWGKRDTELILPINSSLSGTIHQDSMKSTTSVMASPSFETDEMWLNGKAVDLKASARMQNVMHAVRALARPTDDVKDWTGYKLRIVSSNNFPTAAGLASSASGLACFTAALAALYNVEETEEGQLSMIARQGSGSACRSMYGGWVAWMQGEKEDGSDSKAVQIADEQHWSDMRVLICVVNKAAKETPSTSGMQTSCKTSELIHYRASVVVPKRMNAMIDAIKRKDFAQFAEITMKDSNQFHAICADTYPPIFYMNETSHRIISIVNAFNAAGDGKVKAAYTYDAGPNAVIYVPNQHMGSLLQLLNGFFGCQVDDNMNLVEGSPVATELVTEADEACNKINKELTDKAVSRIIVSSVGPGPRRVV